MWEIPNGLMTGDMILAGDDKLYYLFREKSDAPLFLVCCNFKTGKEQWRAEQKMKYTPGKATKALSLLSYYRGMIFMGSSSRHTFHVNTGSIYAVSASDGSLLWKYDLNVVGHKATTEDIFPINDNLWVKVQGLKL